MYAAKLCPARQVFNAVKIACMFVGSCVLDCIDWFLFMTINV